MATAGRFPWRRLRVALVVLSVGSVIVVPGIVTLWMLLAGRA